MNKRNANAIAISDGACNPKAIIGAMSQALLEHGLANSDVIFSDPALKLMVHQLAFLMGIPTGETQEEWVAWRNACNGEGYDQMCEGRR